MREAGWDIEFCQIAAIARDYEAPLRPATGDYEGCGIMVIDPSRQKIFKVIRKAK